MLSLNILFDDILPWCDRHEALIRTALLSCHHGQTRLTLVPAAGRYCLALDPHMTELEISVRSRFVTRQLAEELADSIEDAILLKGDPATEWSAHRRIRQRPFMLTNMDWRDQFKRASAMFADWAEARRARVLRVAANLEFDRVRFVVIPASDTFDFQLCDEQVELGRRFYSEVDLHSFETLQTSEPDQRRCFGPMPLLIWDRATKTPASSAGAGVGTR